MHVQDEINGLQQLFRNIDADNSGTITIDELRAALTSCNGKMSVRATSIRCVWDGAMQVRTCVLIGTSVRDFLAALLLSWQWAVVKSKRCLVAVMVGDPEIVPCAE